jgi:hypothetical protein
MVACLLAMALPGYAAAPNPAHEKFIKDTEKKLNDWCKSSVTFEVDWKSYPTDKDAVLAKNVAMELLNNVRKYCMQTEGSARLAAKVKRVVIRFGGPPVPAVGHDETSGTFTMHTNSGSANSARDIVATLDRMAKASGGLSERELRTRDRYNIDVKSSEKQLAEVCKVAGMTITVDWPSYPNAVHMSSIPAAADNVVQAARGFQTS